MIVEDSTLKTMLACIDSARLSTKIGLKDEPEVYSYYTKLETIYLCIVEVLDEMTEAGARIGSEEIQEYRRLHSAYIILTEAKHFSHLGINRNYPIV